MGELNRRTFNVSVRDLVALTERRGDLNYRFSGRSSSVAGIKGHQRVQKARGDDYVAEHLVNDTIEADDLCLVINGRVDGYYPSRSPMVVEEIKTTRADVERIPLSIQALHWGQGRVYAHLLAVEHGLAEDATVIVRLCYLQLQDDSQVLYDESWLVADIAAYYKDLVDRQLDGCRRLAVWQAGRDDSIAALEFPYPAYRAGQRDMAVSVYRAMAAGAQLVLQAPTGIGKTLAALFPAIKAVPGFGFDKVFYVSAKTSGQQMARSAVDSLRDKGLKLRDITLTSREKICFTPGAACDAASCDYAVGYYDKLGDALMAGMAGEQRLDRAAIEALAREHALCPFELSLDLTAIADLVICDYNYVFDPAVYLRRWFENTSLRHALLIDEAHNLVDRGRDMFSAELGRQDLLALRRELKTSLPLQAKALTRLNNQWLALLRPHRPAIEEDGHAELEALPGGFINALRGFVQAAEDWLQLNQSADIGDSLRQGYFDCQRLLRIAEAVDEHYACLLIQRSQGLVLKLHNLNPGPGLAAGLKRVKAVVSFSATLMPRTYYETLLGTAAEANWYRIDPPFDSSRLGVFTTGFISTTYRHRNDSLYELVDTIDAVIRQRRGHYLVFLPSFYYLNLVQDKYRERYPDSDCVTQTPMMDETDRAEFLARFDHDDSRSLIGFAVLGGQFGEGIDLKGRRLIGVIIAGVGLPQLCVERDLERDYFNRQTGTGQGFEFAYQYPGMNRVLQTAGRVIRDESDTGIICLIDNRFNEARYRQLMPPQWQVEPARNRDGLVRAVAAFWSRQDTDAD